MTTPGRGPVPYGYRIEREPRLVEIPEEQSVLWLIAHLRGLGWTLQRIAEELETLSLRPRSGVPFSRQTLHLMLRRGPVGEAAAELRNTG